ncbi:CDP-6-deoxy-delta-3,4-glucoseen reductase [Hahella chejuensis]|nr:CDP-6-deoxy-delta-3,4-glucoseen reductase [Hahella chejuensis]
MTSGRSWVLTKDLLMRRHLRFQPSGHEFDAAEGETILAAALRQGYKILHACDNGVCHICAARLLKGNVAGGVGESGRRRLGADEVLLCKATPEGDCEFELRRIWGPNELETKTLAFQIKAVTALSDDVYQVQLLAPAGALPEFFAGQYLELLAPGVEAAFFSIANAPGTREVELHIQVHQESRSALAIYQYLTSESVVRARLPLGKCFISGVPDMDVSLIAAGTGFAQIKSIVEYLLAQGFERKLSIYWGVRQSQEMYARALSEAWAERHENVSFTPVMADNRDNEWQGHHAELVRAVLAERRHWDNSLVYVSGSPTMVYTAMDALAPLGLPGEQFFSDVLEYAPRG